MAKKLRSFLEGFSESISLFNQIPMPKNKVKYIYDLSYKQISRGWDIVYSGLKNEY